MANTDLETTFTNARLDAETLKVFINGNDDEFAEPRLNTPYPTVKALIKALIEQGTLDATLFETKELLLADTNLVDGSYALVAEDELKENNGFYVKKEGVWVFSGYNPLQQSIEYVDKSFYPMSLEDQEASAKYLLSFTDEDYNILAYLDNELNANFVGVNTDKIETPDLAFIQNDSFNGYLPTVDKFGNVLSYYDDSGAFKYIGQGDNVESNTGVNINRLETDIIHIDIYGQSLSLGLGSATVSKASEAPNALTPSAGIEDGQQSSVKQGINALPLSSTGLVPFNPALNPNLKECPIYGATIHFQKSLDARGSSTKILPSAHGYGASPIASLSKGAVNYDVGIAQSKRYREYASARGESCLTQFMLWVQGEADISTGMSKDTYKSSLNKLISDYQKDINQPALKPIMLTYQVSSHTKRTPNSTPDIAYAQLECSNENPYIKMACATYPMTYYDGVHMVANSYKWMGAYFGKVMDWMLENKRTDWKPLQPEKVMRTGKVVTVYFHVPVKPLVLDTIMVTNPSNYGFTVKNSSGTTLAISSVTLKGDDRVNIVLVSEPTSDVTVTYALGTTGADAGYSTGARGNLRDSDNTVSNTLDENGNPYSLYNWCVLFSKQEGSL